MVIVRADVVTAGRVHNLLCSGVAAERVHSLPPTLVFVHVLRLLDILQH